MDIWLQCADTSLLKVADETVEGVMKAFREFNWEREIQRGKEIKYNDSVAPGLGLGNYGDEHFLHIMPLDTQNTEVLYVHSLIVEGPPSFWNRLLRTTPRRLAVDDETYKERFPIAQVESLVRAWFAQDEEAMLKILQ